MMNTHARTLTLLGSSLLLGLASCASGSKGLGTMPVGIVELYDGAQPDGLMEIELARDGTVLEMEADVPPDALPAAVRSAAMARLPGGTITGAERELHPEGRFWEVKLTHQGREWEVICDDAGKVVETEQGLRREEAPAAVLAAADQAVAGSFKSVELIEGRSGTSYHVKKTMGGASYKIVISPEGKVLRKVREQRAEIEIPLKD
jgi:uncharacterized membrane protein YkoI